MFPMGTWNTFKFRNNFIGWKEPKMPIKSINYEMSTNFVIKENKTFKVRRNFQTSNKKGKCKKNNK